MNDVSRRNSVDSVGSNSTAASVDSSGQPRPSTARKTFKVVAADTANDVLKLPSAGSLKRRVDSLESNSADSESSVKKQRSDSVDDFGSFFGHHFLSGMAGVSDGAVPKVGLHKVP